MGIYKAYVLEQQEVVEEVEEEMIDSIVVCCTAVRHSWRMDVDDGLLKLLVLAIVDLQEVLHSVAVVVVHYTTPLEEDGVLDSLLRQKLLLLGLVGGNCVHLFHSFAAAMTCGHSKLAVPGLEPGLAVV